MDGKDGEDGEDGEPGPGTRVVFFGQADANTLFVDLPPDAGTLEDPPVVNVYISDDPDGPVLAVNDGFTEDTTWFALVQGEPNLVVGINNMIVGWYYWVVVVY